ncbi:hypothetical protein K488DRAFT_15864, partial [Vararia minispora EC-137]
ISPAFLAPPRLTTKRNIFMAALTIAVWDILNMSPTMRKLFVKQPRDWPLLKTLVLLLAVGLIVSQIVQGIALFYADLSREKCERFFIFEPVITTILLFTCSLVHVIRIRAIYSNSSRVFRIMVAMLVQQIVITSVCCAFYERIPVLDGQGCIAGPKALWVGVYWISTTLFYLTSMAFALRRSLESRQVVQANFRNIVFRDALLCYVTIPVVHLLTVLLCFLSVPNDAADTVRTTTTTFTLVMTCVLTLRIVFTIRSSLYDGGKF